MVSSKQELEGMLMLEKPLIRSPLEKLRKSFRNIQKHLDKDLNLISNSLKNDLSLIQLESIQSNDYNQLKFRCLHIKSTLLDGYHHNDNNLIEEFKDIRIQRWIVDWCLRNNNKSVANLLIDKSNIHFLIDNDLTDQITKIESDLLNFSCDSALAWCNENKLNLRKLSIQFEFDLRLQQYIEIVRQGNIQSAISYLRHHLISHFSTHSKQIQQAVALLAFPESSIVGVYRNLYNKSRWSDLSLQFKAVALHLYGLSTQPMLHVALSVGLPSLKLQCCSIAQDSSQVDNHVNEFEHLYNDSTFLSTKSERLLDNHSTNCPTCDPELLGALAQQVPHSHHTNSSIVCKISGKVVKDGEMLAFPNGRVYSKSALHDMAQNDAQNMVKCPRDGTIVHYSKLRKVFVS
ncbi:hypothetical protein E3P92_02787 [Wallemia ichthyophaga]|uniref:Macrophage erythroblast attacher n=1 Tax=Wallemia ichthyophaga TaxID=245174 RepID=A0A4T0I2D4_WALIC|nr:hypothetical protein E3P91_02742 [Wallemia ichthyophaga]TIA80883.1 hypothetical protein E3P98_02421 [Wallemia ichthyophaga]TIA98317.1 hypothetical protein E3P95_02456 [Wallemia ichthyophaga]TIA99484.1 hypothetical protein E3P94_02563 [Wallemia ichthyophaga]TIB11110.1 hypothetical protein E3P90_02612 [Wallemia ichthyophaga]